MIQRIYVTVSIKSMSFTDLQRVKGNMSWVFFNIKLYCKQYILPLYQLI